MSNRLLSRRAAIAAAVAAPAMLRAAGPQQKPDETPAADVRYCLNTSTIRGQKLSLPEQVELAAAAGFDGIEPWVGDVDAYVQSGGRPDELRSRIADLGLRVESAIGFARWCVNDDAERAAGLEAMRKDMRTMASIGGERIAAPPVGMHASDAPGLNLDDAAARYAAVLEIGRDEGVTPQLEFWGPSRNLSKLPEALYVAAAAGHPDACLLPDIYHMFRGGTSFDAASLLPGAKIHCFHLNDYPEGLAAKDATDADRVYPGEGVAPIAAVIRSLLASGFAGALSIELFNRDYWTKPAAEVAGRSLAAMKAVVAEAVSADG